MTDVEEVRQELQKIATLVVTARRFLATGTLFDLSALQERVSHLAALVQSLPREDALPFREELQSLLRRLDSLEEELREKLREVGPSQADPTGTGPTDSGSSAGSL